MFRRPDVPSANSADCFEHRHTSQNSPRNVVWQSAPVNSEFYNAFCPLFHNVICDLFRRHEQHVNRNVICAWVDHDRVTPSSEASGGLIRWHDQETMPPAPPREQPPEAPMFRALENDPCREAFVRQPRDHTQNTQTQNRTQAAIRPVITKTGAATRPRSISRSFAPIHIHLR